MQLALIDILPFLLLILLFYNAKAVKPISDFNNDYLSIESGKCMRGFFALLVLMHHISQVTTDGLLFSNLNYIGFLPVSIFFFLSGYGLQKSHMNTEDYKNGFLIKRVIKILIPYVIVTFLFWILYLANGFFFSVKDVFVFAIKGNPIATHSWFIISIMAFYFIFWLLMLLFNKHHGRMIVGAFIWNVVYVLFCFGMIYGVWWYDASIVFVFGMLWAYKEKSILPFVKKYYKIVLFLVIEMFLICFFVRDKSIALDPLNYKDIILTMISAILFSIIVLLINLKIKFKCKTLAKIGEISLELYLVHGLFILGLRSNIIYIKNDSAYAFLCIIGSLILGKIFHKFLSFSSKAKKNE